MSADNLLNIPDPDTPIYRIFDKRWFMPLMTTSKNGLLHPSKWEDPFENFFLRSEVTGPSGEVISMESLSTDWYGQCWTYNADTDAMWRIYSGMKEGIRISTTVRKLFNSFYDGKDQFAPLKFFCGKVKYLTEQQIVSFMGTTTFQDIQFGGSGRKFAELFCIKREAFAHENEVRLLFQDTDPRRGKDKVANFDFDLNAICDNVVLDPRLTDPEAAALEAQIRCAGCKLPISKSPLYRTPKFTVRLA